MKSTTITMVLAIVLGLTIGPARAEVPATLTYSGHLTDDEIPVEGTVNAVFELYNGQSGGAPVWSETHNEVALDSGLLTVELGSITDLTSLLTGAEYWLEVTIDGQAMLPRTPFRSVPYARKAAESDTVGGHSAAELMSGATPSAAQVTYDNTTSGLSATNVQAALDELMTEIVALRAENAALQAEVEANTAAIAENKAYIGGNSTAIGHNKTDIAENETAIADNATAIADNAIDIANNAGDILDLQNLTASMSVVGNEFYFTGVNVNAESLAVSGTVSAAAFEGDGSALTGIPRPSATYDANSNGGGTEDVTLTESTPARQVHAVTITAPTAGKVLLNASGTFSFESTSEDQVRAWITTNSNPAAVDYQCLVGGHDPNPGDSTDTWEVFSLNRFYNVSAGTHTYYLHADLIYPAGRQATVIRSWMTAEFIPD